MAPQEYKLEKAKQIFAAVTHTAGQITEGVKELPRTGKKRRNVFVKAYNRRPRNKQKRAQASFKIAMAAMIGAAQIYMVASQSIPKFKTGTV